jgi:hypothetical protein
MLLDLVVFESAPVCQEPNEIFVAIRSSFQGSSAQTTLEFSRHHTDTSTFNNLQTQPAIL